MTLHPNEEEWILPRHHRAVLAAELSPKNPETVA
jgi:hypothetical protein